MSLYSVYTGLIYNEWFSMPTYIFGTSHFECQNTTTNTRLYYPALPPPRWPRNATTGMFEDYPASLIVPGQPVDPRDCTWFGGMIKAPYFYEPVALGVDAMWHSRKTELPYMNSVKMKMSILVGVVHMNFGILMSLFNNLDNRDMLSTVCEFIPQMIFMNAIFGYLCILILIKWFKAGCTADLYNVLIRMFLGMGDVNPVNQLFPGQKGLQQFLLFIAFVSVPWMLLPKPLILKRRWEAAQRNKSSHGASVQMAHSTSYGSIDHEDEESRRPLGGHDSSAPVPSKLESGGGGGHGHGHGHGDHFEFGEVRIGLQGH